MSNSFFEYRKVTKAHIASLQAALDKARLQVDQASVAVEMAERKERQVTAEKEIDPQHRFGKLPEFEQFSTVGLPAASPALLRPSLTVFSDSGGGTKASDRLDKSSTRCTGICTVICVTASETEEGKAWAESRIKQLTGGGSMVAEHTELDPKLSCPP